MKRNQTAPHHHLDCFYTQFPIKKNGTFDFGTRTAVMKKQTFHYCSHNYSWSEASAASCTDILNLDISGGDPVIVVISL